MICPNCNKPNNEGSKFCIYCGTKLELNTEPNVNSTTVETPTFEVNNDVFTNNIETPQVQTFDNNVIENNNVVEPSITSFDNNVVEPTITSFDNNVVEPAVTTLDNNVVETPINSEPTVQTFDNNINNNEMNTMNEFGNFNNETTQVNNMNAPVNNIAASQTNNVGTTPVTKKPGNPLNYFGYMIASIIKPNSSFEEEREKLKDPKNSLLLTLILTGIAVVITLLYTMIDTTIYASKLGDFKLVMESLKEIGYLKLIGQSFLRYGGFLILTGFIYYIVGLILNKESNFFEKLSISVSAAIPYFVSTTLLAPLLGKIWAPLYSIINSFALAFMLVVLIKQNNKDIKETNIDKKMFLSILCIGLVLISKYFIFEYTGVENEMDKLEDIFDIFNIFG